MPIFKIRLNLDGYESVVEELAACVEMIEENLNTTASSIEILAIEPDEEE